MYAGIVLRAELLEHVSLGAFNALVQSRRLHRVFRGVYADLDAGPVDDTLVRRAALAYANRNVQAGSELAAYLCCESAGAEWGLPMCRTSPVTVSVPRGRMVRPQAGLAVHRHLPTKVQIANDAALVPIEIALVRSFARLPVGAAREMVLRSVQDGLVAPDDVMPHVSKNLRGRRVLLDCLELAAGGSHSELEIAAAARVLDDFGLRDVFEQQYDALFPGLAYQMDFAARDLRIDFETDGSRYHRSALARTRDNRRDLELRARGWHVVRALYEEVVDNPERIAKALLAVLYERGWTGRPTTTAGRVVAAGVASTYRAHRARSA